MAKRYQRGNQNPYIEEGKTTQWPKDTKGVIRIRISKKKRQHNGQKEKVQKDKQRSTKQTLYRLESKRPIIRYGDTVIISMYQSQSDQVYVSATK
jgi:hypothetical protein